MESAQTRSRRSIWLITISNPLVLLLLIGILLFTMLIALMQGAVPLTPSEVWQALWHRGDATHQVIVWDLRLPRILAGVLVGAALGLSGALLQGMLRNGLAEPYLLGVSAGAGIVAIILITLGVLQTWVPLAAWVGAVTAAFVVYALGRTSNGVAVERLILGGVAVSSLLFAVQTVFLLLAEEGRVQAALVWLAGSLNGRGWREVSMAFPYLAIALVAGCLLGRSLNCLTLGDDIAVSLGISLQRSRLYITALATLLTAGAVSIAGLVGFVGLLIPNGVRLFVGSDYRWVLPLSALGGAWMLTAADLLARLTPVELPVGAVTALLGAPLFIALLYQRGKR